MTPADLQFWRKQQGLSQEALSALLGIDHMTVSRWERGERSIPPYLHWALYGIAAAEVNRQSLAALRSLEASHTAS